MSIEDLKNEVLNEEIDNIILLNDENGNQVKFEFLDFIEYDDKEFVVLLPAEDDEADENGEVIILQVITAENPEDEEYVGIEDAELLETLYGIFKERFSEEFNFVD